MAATEDLKKDHFMPGLRKDLAKDLKVAGVRDTSFNNLINRALVIEQADEEKNEAKRRNKESVEQGNFVKQHSNNNKRKGTSVVQDQSKSKRQKNHQKEVPQKPKCNQYGRIHPGECRANTRTCFKCERKDTLLGTARKIVRNKKRLMLEYSHSPRRMWKETPQ